MGTNGFRSKHFSKYLILCSAEENHTGLKLQLISWQFSFWRWTLTTEFTHNESKLVPNSPYLLASLFVCVTWQKRSLDLHAILKENQHDIKSLARLHRLLLNLAGYLQTADVCVTCTGEIKCLGTKMALHYAADGCRISCCVSCTGTHNSAWTVTSHLQHSWPRHAPIKLHFRSLPMNHCCWGW